MTNRTRSVIVSISYNEAAPALVDPWSTALGDLSTKT